MQWLGKWDLYNHLIKTCRYSVYIQCLSLFVRLFPSVKTTNLSLCNELVLVTSFSHNLMLCSKEQGNLKWHDFINRTYAPVPHTPTHNHVIHFLIPNSLPALIVFAMDHADSEVSRSWRVWTDFAMSILFPPSPPSDLMIWYGCRICFQTDSVSCCFLPVL